METINNFLDYSKFNVIDFCYFLNDKADINSNKYLKGFNPRMFSKVEMYEYIKFKTDNFDKIKFQLVFGEISEFVFAYMGFYKLTKVDGEFINVYEKDYEEDYDFTDKEPYEYICKTLELNKGLRVNCQQVVEFIELAENEYKRVFETTGTTGATTKPNQLQTKLTVKQRGELYELLISNGFISGSTDKEGFIWAFGGENEKQPGHWEPIEWIDKSVTRHEPNIQTLFELLYLLGVNNNTEASNPNNLYRKIEYYFKDFKNIAAKNPFEAQQKTERQKLLKQIIEKL